ncbi:MAG: ABC transporter ATP-binding protein/permease [Chloroflexota bacterium]|nr:ABC transporter ATP-binding protein/permease [Chloroflexota bacterium]
MAMPIELIRGQARGLLSSVDTIRRFRGELYPHWRTLLGALLCAIGYTAMRLAEPWPLKFIFDNVLTGIPIATPFPWLNHTIGDDRIRILLVATGAILALAALRGVFYYYQSYLTSRVGQEVVLRIRRRLFAHLQRLSLRFHNQSSTGDLLTRLTSDVNNLRELLTASLLSLVSETVIMVGFVTIMFIMNWRLALLAVITIPVIFALVTVFSGRIRKAAGKQRRREGELAARLHEALSGIHVVQLFAREDEEDERLRGLNKRSLRSGLKTARLEGRLNQGVELAVAVGMALTLWFGATEVIAGRLTPGELIVFVAYMQSFYRPLRRISRVAERASKASSCVDRITEVLDRESEVRDGDRQAPPFRGELRFDHVGFAYADGTPVLRDIDLTITPGQTVALVGPSGAGKSTLLSLVPRLYDPTTGAVLLDGQDARDFTLKSLRDQVSVVPQDGMLFAGTVSENIAYGKPEASAAEIEAAARAANIHDHIAGLAEGYDSVVSERGVSLSGGQRQRLAIARAMVKDAPIVLLDEPTTGLDAESEELVMEALDRLLSGRTAIVIAHRLATIRRANVILVIDGGQVVERGTHAELLLAAGLYRSLHQRQLVVQDVAAEPRLGTLA